LYIVLKRISDFLDFLLRCLLSTEDYVNGLIDFMLLWVVLSRGTLSGVRGEAGVGRSGSSKRRWESTCECSSSMSFKVSSGNSSLWVVSDDLKSSSNMMFGL
jgi:hypothetical protein